MESGNPKIPRRMKVSRELAKTEMIGKNPFNLCMSGKQ